MRRAIRLGAHIRRSGDCLSLLLFCILATLIPCCGLADPELVGTFPSSGSNNDIPAPGAPGNGEVFPAEVVDVDAGTLTLRASPGFCCDPLEIQFSAESEDPFVDSAADFFWDFGDGRRGEGRTVQHRFSWKGDYQVSLVAQLPDGTRIETVHILNLRVDDSGRWDSVFGTPLDGSSSPPDPLSTDPAQTPTPDRLQIDAGNDKLVQAGSVVTLAGRLTGDSPIEGLRFLWTQTGGPSVVLEPRNRQQTTFVAPPAIETTTVLTFELQMFAGAERFTDSVRVRVVPAPDNAGTGTAPSVWPKTATVTGIGPVILELEGTDADGDDLTFFVEAPPEHGRLGEINNSGMFSGFVEYTPPTGFVGNDSFSYRATDGVKGSHIVRFTVIVVTPATTIDLQGATYHVPMNRRVRLTAKARAVRTIGPLAYRITDLPEHGTISEFVFLSPAESTIVYTPNADFVGVDRFRIQATDGRTISQEATITLEIKRRMIPWIEINAPMDPALGVVSAADGATLGMSYLDYCLLGLEQWANVSDTVIISTVPGNSRLVFTEVMARKAAHVKIIGGIKTFTLPGARPGDTRPYDFTNVEGWQRLAGEAVGIAAITGNTTVLLENETALEPYHLHQEPIDYRKLPAALAPLQGYGLDYWWYFPTILTNTPAFVDREAHTTVFVSVVQSLLPRSVFVAGSTSWYDWKDNNRGERDRRDAMNLRMRREFTRDPLLVTIDGYMLAEGVARKRCYTPAEALDEIDYLGFPEAILYPGASNWLRVGRELSRIMPPMAEIMPNP